MFLLNHWYVAAVAEELTDRPLARTICGLSVVMFRTASGGVAALVDRCPHRYAPLSAGQCVGETIACAYHGIEFDASGACARIPHQPTIPSAMRVRAFPLVERWGWAWIWLGDPACADAEAIPDYHWLAAPG
ncbi:MAG TPA: Rieske 2Fe-2S domain-containing protein, partial [Stellaceae bacterium]|nr:Rieske 2Fe-2S domain-containing protein [Stellaceae bacterium]